MVTHIKVKVLERLLLESNYDRQKTSYIVKGFSKGFDIRYRGLKIRKSTSENIPIKVGSKDIMWEKLMKEVRLGWHAGPFSAIPYENFMQSPIGLVPKAKDQMRLIFHLSYEFADGLGSLNGHTEQHLCGVKYNDLDHAVENCLKLVRLLENKLGIVFFGKTDICSAFLLVPLRPDQFCWLIIKAEDSVTRKIFYFADKCLPFGASISCGVFQAFSDALKHILEWRVQLFNNVTNYLDDYLFLAYTLARCNWLISQFLSLCEEVGCPINEDKTEWASIQIIFLGILLCGRSLTLGIPEDKRVKAVNLLEWMVNQRSVTVKHLQKLRGILNFLTKAIFAGRTFTRGMYAKIKLTNGKGQKLKFYHHVTTDKEFKSDSWVWLDFLKKQPMCITLSRPFVDLNIFEMSDTLRFYMDSSANPNLGFGCVFENRWFFGKWEYGFVAKFKPSIEYLELARCYALL